MGNNIYIYDKFGNKLIYSKYDNKILIPNRYIIQKNIVDKLLEYYKINPKMQGLVFYRKLSKSNIIVNNIFLKEVIATPSTVAKLIYGAPNQGTSSFYINSEKTISLKQFLDWKSENNVLTTDKKNYNSVIEKKCNSIKNGYELKSSKKVRKMEIYFNYYSDKNVYELNELEFNIVVYLIGNIKLTRKINQEISGISLNKFYNNEFNSDLREGYLKDYLSKLINLNAKFSSFDQSEVVLLEIQFLELEFTENSKTKRNAKIKFLCDKLKITENDLSKLNHELYLNFTMLKKHPNKYNIILEKINKMVKDNHVISRGDITKISKELNVSLTYTKNVMNNMGIIYKNNAVEDQIQFNEFISEKLNNGYKLYRDIFLINLNHSIYKLDINKNMYKELQIYARVINGRGYLKVPITTSVNSKNYFYLHKLIANLFLENPNDYKYVKCKDGDYRNVKLENLEWIKNPASNRSNLKDKNNISYLTDILNHFEEGLTLEMISEVIATEILREKEKNINEFKKIISKIKKTINEYSNDNVLPELRLFDIDKIVNGVFLNEKAIELFKKGKYD